MGRRTGLRQRQDEGEWLKVMAVTPEMRPVVIGGADSIPERMLAAVYHGRNDMRLETVAVPRIGAGELLVRIHTCGICGTDLKKISTGSHSAPRIFGHEMAGVVVARGAGVTRFREGDRGTFALLPTSIPRTRNPISSWERSLWQHPRHCPALRRSWRGLRKRSLTVPSRIISTQWRCGNSSIVVR